MERIQIPDVDVRESTSENERGDKEKLFKPRESLITQWRESKNFRATYHTLAIIFIYFYMEKIISYVNSPESFDKFKFLEKFSQEFEAFIKGIFIWLGIQIFVLLIYLGFQLWIVCGKNLNNSWYNSVWLTIYISFVVEYFVAISYLLSELKLTLPINIILSTLLVISLMKIHSFVRTNVPKHLKAKEMNKPPTFKAYLYFLYAPTFLYRDEYPRNETIRWKTVVICLMETIGAILILFTSINWTSQFYQDFGKEEVSIGRLISIVNLTYISGVCIIFVTFIGIIHSFVNFTAELLMFADRKFYSDWWNGQCGEEFIKFSNHIVQDFTYTFIYRDLKKYFFDRKVSKVLTFIISGIFHDYIFTISFGFCLPLFTCSMLIHGLILTYWNKKFFWENNFIFLLGLFGLSSFYVVFYEMEFFTRTNLNVDRYSSLFTPFFWRNISTSSFYDF